MPLNVLQLSQVKKAHAFGWRRRGERALECFLGGMIGAMGAIIVLGLLL